MKTERTSIPLASGQRPDSLLTTHDVAALLRVHPKHVYRLLGRGLPAHRVGGEWRFVTAEVLRWSRAGRRSNAHEPESHRERAAAHEPVEAPGPVAAPEPVAGPEPVVAPEPAPLLATNGDLAIERLLGRLTVDGQRLLGHVQADRGGAFEMLKRGEVLAAGCHGNDIPTVFDDQRLAFIHLVEREVGLAFRHDLRLRDVRQIRRWHLASRPSTAGVRTHFDEHLRREGMDPTEVHSHATLLPSHREVVCAVARGEADVGLASLAWAHYIGLATLPLCRESYGLLVRASLLGDPRIVALCAIAQSPDFRRDVAAVHGYRAQRTGTISYESPGPATGVMRKSRALSRTTSG